MREIVAVRAGMLSSVQDLGRFGHRAEAVAQSGAIDSLALRAANRLAGNDDAAAAVEVTLGSAAFRFAADARFALCGADCDADLDGAPVAAWSARVAPAGSLLTLRPPRTQARTILAVDGGIDVDAVLGSRSTDLVCGFGGYRGRALRDGDRLALGTPAARYRNETLRVKPPQWSFDASVVPVLSCDEFASFSAQAREAFWNATWTVSRQSNRMGYRLEGSALHRELGTNGTILSHAVFPGVIQIPPSGEPIVLLNDAQTTGGYPKAGVVAGTGYWALAQLAPGAALRFVPCTLEEARKGRAQLDAYLEEVKAAIASRRPHS